MAQSAKSEDGSLERILQLNSPAYKIYDIYQNKCDLFSTIMFQDITNVEKISADVWLWTFVDDKCGSWKDTVGPIDNVTKKHVTWTLSDGEVPKKLYDSLKLVYTFTPNNGGCMAEAVLNYKKKNANVPVPEGYMDFIVKMWEEVDKFLQAH